MELLVVGALIGITSVFLGILFMHISENQKKKALLQQIITRALVELNENKDLLKQMLTYLKPVDEIEPVELDKKFFNLLEPNTSPLKGDELSQLKTAGEFINYVDIKTNVEINNIITRFRYLNRFITQNNNLDSFSIEEYKTIHHTYEMVYRLINTLTKILEKIKG